MSDPVHSIHVLGSREFGGADQFYVRLLRALYAAGQSVTAIHRPASPVADALAGDAFDRIHLPLSNRWDAWSWWRIRQEILARQPCVVQTYMGRATRLTRVPRAARALHIARLGGFYKIDGYYRHADAWVGNTRAICDFLVREGLPAKRVHHIGNFVPDPVEVSDAQKDEFRRAHKIPADARVVFALGRMIPKKGFQDLLQAVARSPKEADGRPVVWMLAGDGPSRPLLESMVLELNLSDRVRLIGWQNPPDLAYAVADVFVCPSRHEPLGNVILEAWNHRLPVVSTRSDGALELIEHGVRGLLCDCRDPAGIAATVSEVLAAAPAQRDAMADAGHAWLQATYSQATIVGRYLALYRELLAGKIG